MSAAMYGEKCMGASTSCAMPRDVDASPGRFGMWPQPTPAVVGSSNLFDRASVIEAP